MSLVDLLPHPWMESTSPKVRAIVDALDAAAGELDAALDAAIREAQVDNAADLDDLTELLGPHQPAVLAVLFGLVGVDNTRRLLRAISAANHSHGDVESIIAVFDAATADLNSGAGVDIRVETSDAAELEIQFEHSPAPLDDLGFRDILRSILGRAASGGIVVSHVTTSL